MRILTALLLLSAGFLMAQEALPEIRGLQELRGCDGKRVILKGVYRDPGKGGPSVDCGFVQLEIGSKCFVTKAEDGQMRCQLVDGQKIRFEAVIEYTEEKMFRYRKPHGEPPQMRGPEIRVIRGKEYIVHRESFSIREAKLLELDAPRKSGTE